MYQRLFDGSYEQVDCDRPCGVRRSPTAFAAHPRCSPCPHGLRRVVSQLTANYPHIIEGLRSKRRVKRFRVEVEIGLLSNRTLTHVQRLQVEITQVSSYNHA